jgi:choline kinase
MIDAIIIVPEITKGMKSVGSKSLLRIRKSKYILDYQIEQISSVSKKIRIHIATGFDNEKIKKAVNKYNNVNICHNDEYEATNYGKSLEILVKSLPENSKGLFILCSGILFKKQTLHHTNFKNNSKIFLLNKPKINFNIGCNQNTEDDYLFYDLPETWSECVFLNKNAIKILQQQIELQNISQMYIFEIINLLISKNVYFEKKYLSKGKFFKVNTIKDINKAKIFI